MNKGGNSLYLGIQFVNKKKLLYTYSTEEEEEYNYKSKYRYIYRFGYFRAMIVT